MNITQQNIDNFFKESKIAVAGVSRDPKKFGHLIFKKLVEINKVVAPVHPQAQEIEGIQCFSSVEQLPDDIQSLLIVTPKSQTNAVFKQALNKGISNIWIQQQSETPETFDIAAGSDKNIIMKKCAFMFADPVKGVHKFHKAIVKLFGKLPK